MTHSVRPVGCRLLAAMLVWPAFACDGPNERAGREQDRAAAVAAGQNMTTEGPNELAGEAQDRVEHADRKAADAAADALEVRADQIRGAADTEADKLDEQAEAVRKESKQK